MNATGICAPGPDEIAKIPPTNAPITLEIIEPIFLALTKRITATVAIAAIEMGTTVFLCGNMANKAQTAIAANKIRNENEILFCTVMVAREL